MVQAVLVVEVVRVVGGGAGGRWRWSESWEVAGRTVWSWLGTVVV